MGTTFVLDHDRPQPDARCAKVVWFSPARGLLGIGVTPKPGAAAPKPCAGSRRPVWVHSKQCFLPGPGRSAPFPVSFFWGALDSSWKAQRDCSYFDFHAAPVTDGVSPKTHALFPVWGFGDIVASNHPVAKVGERVYGYFAPARYLGKRSTTTLIDKLSQVHYSSGILHEGLE